MSKKPRRTYTVDRERPLTKRLATPDQILRNGHIAAQLRKFLDEHDWRVINLADALGLPRQMPQLYHWVAGTAAPGEKYRPALSKLMNIPIEDLIPRYPGSTSHVGTSPSPAAPMMNGQATQIVAPPKRVIGFSVYDDGSARVEMDVKMGVRDATDLFRLVMDHGVPAAPKEDDIDGEARDEHA